MPQTMVALLGAHVRLACPPAWALLLIVLIVGAGCDGSSGDVGAGPSPPGAVRGTLQDRVAALHDAMPRRADEGFEPPTAADLAHWRSIVEALLDADTARARTLVAEHAPSYRVFTLTDTTVDRSYLLLQESPAVESGWGSVVVNPTPRRNLAVEVPHPVFDLDTHREGADLFRQTGARVLLLAGTHRCSNREPSPCDGRTDVCDDGRYAISDMAHVATAPFQATHEVVTDRWPTLTALSLHGNGNDDCETVFLSSGVADDTPARLDTLARSLRDRGVEVGLPGSSSCPLVGSTNVQGRYSNGASSPCTEAASTAEGTFVHVEQRRSFRGTPEAYGRLIEAVNATFSPLR